MTNIEIKTLNDVTSYIEGIQDPLREYMVLQGEYLRDEIEKYKSLANKTSDTPLDHIVRNKHSHATHAISYAETTNMKPEIQFLDEILKSKDFVDAVQSACAFYLCEEPIDIVEMSDDEKGIYQDLVKDKDNYQESLQYLETVKQNKKKFMQRTGTTMCVSVLFTGLVLGITYFNDIIENLKESDKPENGPLVLMVGMVFTTLAIVGVSKVISHLAYKDKIAEAKENSADLGQKWQQREPKYNTLRDQEKFIQKQHKENQKLFARQERAQQVSLALNTNPKIS